MLDILNKLMKQIVPAFGSGSGGGRSSRSARRAAAAAGGDAEESAQPQEQAPLALRNSYQMVVYLLFSAAYPLEEIYSRAQQVRCFVTLSFCFVGEIVNSISLSAAPSSGVNRLGCLGWERRG